MCTEKIKIELDVQELMMVKIGLTLYETQLLDSLINLSPEQFGSIEETTLRSMLEEVSHLSNVI